jgi:hypothetical protein
LREFLKFAGQRAESHGGRISNIPMLAMFCVAMRRDVFRAVGCLDEGFGLGLFEDDDYSRRVRTAGLRVACAEDVFIHHFGEASFGALVPTGVYAALFEQNRRRFEGTWNVTWTPHRRRRDQQYLDLIESIATAVDRLIPPASARGAICVVSRGDDDLVRALHREGRPAWHFPRCADGTHPGHHPADSREAIAALRAAWGQGARYLLIPSTSAWWLDHYSDFCAELCRCGKKIETQDRCCILFAVAEFPAATDLGNA